MLIRLHNEWAAYLHRIAMTAPLPAHRRLSIFEGTWQTHGRVVATADSPALEIAGTDTYRWLPGRFFMAHNVDVTMGAEHNLTTEIMGYDAATGRYTLYYFDNRGEQGLMYGALQDEQWTIVGETLRFDGRFHGGGKGLSGKWQKKTNSTDWLLFMTIDLIKL